MCGGVLLALRLIISVIFPRSTFLRSLPPFPATASSNAPVTVAIPPVTLSTAPTTCCPILVPLATPSPMLDFPHKASAAIFANPANFTLIVAENAKKIAHINIFETISRLSL